MYSRQTRIISSGNLSGLLKVSWAVKSKSVIQRKNSWSPSPSADGCHSTGMNEVLCHQLRSWLVVASYSCCDLNRCQGVVGLWVTISLSAVSVLINRGGRIGQPLGLTFQTVTSWPFYATGPSPLVAGLLELSQEVTGGHEEFYRRWWLSWPSHLYKRRHWGQVRWFIQRHTASEVAELGLWSLLFLQNQALVHSLHLFPY